MQVVQFLEETKWRRFVADHLLGNIFHTPEMFQVFSRAKNHQPALWATVDDNGDVLALLLPVQITLTGGTLRRLTNRAVVYGSVLCAPGTAGRDALITLLQNYKRSARNRHLFTELRNLSDLRELQPVLAEKGFAYEDHLNFLVDLNRQPEEILQNIGRRTRKHIRRGLRRDEVIIEEANCLEHVAECYKLLAQTYSRARVPLAHKSLFEAAFQVLHPKGMVKFFLAKLGDACVATSIELLHQDVIYGWYGGMDREYGPYRANELLTWHILRWGAENGYRVCDFGGAGKPDEEYGVRDFKAKFGGELVCFGRNRCVHMPRLLWFSEKGYRLLRRWL